MDVSIFHLFFSFLQACPPGSESFRDVQCGMFNDRDIFINGERAKWMSYIRGIKNNASFTSLFKTFKLTVIKEQRKDRRHTKPIFTLRCA